MDTHTGIYLDYAATSPVKAPVLQRMQEVLAAGHGNASSNHPAGNTARGLIEAAREQVAKLAGAEARDVVFTSGATEANNLAIEGTVRAARAQKRDVHVVTLATEHKSVLEPVRALGLTGVATTILRPGTDGRIAAAELEAALRPGTCLVTLLHVNNETGVTQDIASLAAVCAARSVPLHVDACQAAGKLPLSMTGIDLLSFTAHKIGGPQGIGALVLASRHRGKIEPLILGGGQEHGLRAGTLATHQIAGFGLACELAQAELDREPARLTALRERLWQGIQDLPGVVRNGSAANAAPHILNVTFADVEGETLFRALLDFTLSTGSACNSRSGDPSFVLRAMGRSTEEAQASLRFSVGHLSTDAHIDAVVAAIRERYTWLWGMSPARPPREFPESVCAVAWLGEAGAQRLGTWVRFVLQVQSGFVKRAEVQAYGCPETLAASNYVCGRMLDQPVDGLELGTPEEWRQIAKAPVEKLGRMLIIEDAVRALAPA